MLSSQVHITLPDHERIFILHGLQSCILSASKYIGGFNFCHKPIFSKFN